MIRSIAQSGSALRLGRRGLRFESLYSDQECGQVAEWPKAPDY